MIPFGHWRRLYDEGLDRRPRRGPFTPADLATLWLQLSERQMAMRLRIAVVAATYGRPPIARA